MNGIRLYMPLTKVNAETREVTGVFTAEAVDRSKEILDYASSAPYFKAWSDEVAKSSDGKSLGNVREMHTKSAVGKVTELSFDDNAKMITGTVKVVDDGAWEKVQEGVYTGFSIGGEYVQKWTDPSLAAKRYTAKPFEVSLVDLPCLPDATFSLVKRAGGLEKGAGEGDELITEQVAFKSTDASAAFPYLEVDPELEQVWKSRDGQTFGKKADAIKHNEQLDEQDARKQATKGVQAITSAAIDAINNLAKTVSAKDGLPADELKLDDVDPQEDPNVAIAKAAEKVVTEQPLLAKHIFTSMLDTLSSPGAGAVHLRKELPEAFKEKAKEKKDEAKAKDEKDTEAKADDKDEKADDKDEKAEKGMTVGSLKKGLWDVGRIATLISELSWVQENLCWEADYERDGSPLPDELSKIIGTLANFLRKLVVEETAELMAGMEVEFDDAGDMLVIKSAGAPLTEDLPSLLKDITAGMQRELAIDGAPEAFGKLSKALNKAFSTETLAKQELLEKAAETAEKLAKFAKFATPDQDPPGAASAGTEVLEKLNKALAENEVFKATLAKVPEAIEALTKRIKSLEDQPLPAKGAVRAVSKTADGIESGDGSGGPIKSSDDLVKALGTSGLSPNEINTALMKHALRNPVSRIGG